MPEYEFFEENHSSDNLIKVELCHKDGSKLDVYHELTCTPAGDVLLPKYYVDCGVLVSPPSNISEFECCKPKSKPDCVESQEWTYGIDNTGTRFNDIATYCLELSDKSTIEWSQTPQTGWANQLTEWAANIQTAADDAGLAWFVEPRYVDNPNPQNIDGTINGPGGTPSGLPGAPSIPIAVSLIDGGMAWRYVNFQICPGQPVPVRAFRKTSQLFGDGEYNLTAAGAVLGPIQKFWLCTECSDNDGGIEWLKEDPENPGKLIPAEAGEIPNCYEPCGTLALAEAPPDRACEFKLDVACDNNNSINIEDFTNTITRRATICNGEQIAVDFFEQDPDDPAALIGYDLIGDFVDCATGEPIDLPLVDGVIIDCDNTIQSESFDQDVRIVGAKNPIPVRIVEDCNKSECDDFVYSGKLWKLQNPEDEGVLLEYWQPSNLGGSAVGHDNVSNIFGNDLSSHPNPPSHTGILSAPSFTTTSDFTQLTANDGFDEIVDRGGTNGTDQIRMSGYICGSIPFDLIDTNTNTGERGAVAINGEIVVEDNTDSITGDTGAFPPTTLPAGLSEFKIATSDLSAWQGVAPSGGQGVFFFSELPFWECIPVYKCKDTGELIDCDKNPVEVTDKDFWCEPPSLQNSSDDTESLELVELCDGSEGLKVEAVCCNDNVPTRFSRTYNGDNNILSSENIWEESGYDSLLGDFGCNPGSEKVVYFQGSVYVDGKAYQWHTTGLTIPTTENALKQEVITAMNQAAHGTGTSFRLVNGFIETRTRDVDVAYVIQKGLIDENAEICWDSGYFIFRSDADGTFDGDSTAVSVSNPYDPIFANTYNQTSSSGTI